MIVVLSCFLFFFFQAEDGIRDDLVTGVQTCALPISYGWSRESVVSTPGSRVLVSSPNSGGRGRRNQQFSGGRPGRVRGRQGSVSPDFVDFLRLAGDFTTPRR